MLIDDRVYGRISIVDPIILTLIKTPAFQRLKDINQYGGVNFVYPGRFQTSRYEHSIGVWYVLKSIGCNLEIQVAGLLHDIGHTAFSHMLDMAMESEREDYHELISNKIDGIGEINKILTKYKIKLKKVDDYQEIKKSLPEIGADRLDYALRDYIRAKNIKNQFGKKVLNNIVLDKEGIVFTNKIVAKQYAVMGLNAMWEVIYKPEVAVVYQALVEVIRQGINKGWLTNTDLIKTDKYVLKKIISNKKKIPEKFINIFTTKFKVKKVTKVNNYDFKHIKLKVRYFDPFVLIKGERIQLSKIDKTFKIKLNKMIRIFDARKKGEYYKIIWN